MAALTASLAALKLDVKTKSQLYRDAVASASGTEDAETAKSALRDALRELAAAQEDGKAKAGLPAVELVRGGISGDSGESSARDSGASAGEDTAALAAADELGPSTAEIAMEIDTGRFASILCVRKPDEIGDGNFPSNLLSAMELFSKLAMIDHGRRLRKSVDTFAGLLASGPPKESVSMGCAAVCWGCGYVGLPQNAGEVNQAAPASATREKLAKAPAASCGRCGDQKQTNLVRVTRRDGTVIPWIEGKDQANMSEEEREALKRANARAAALETNGGKAPKPNAKCPCGSGKKYKKCCGRR